jgi:hypothetical protein
MNVPESALVEPRWAAFAPPVAGIDGELAELTYDARADEATLVVRHSDGSLELVPQDGQVDSLVRRELVLLPGEVGASASLPDLLDEVAGFVHTYVDLDPQHERVAAAYVLMTWVYDAFSAVPYLHALGPIGTGKTRFLLTVGSLCYRAILAGGAVSPAAIFRAVDRYRGTLIIDESDFKVAGIWAEILKILNSGYHRGLPALRAEPGGGVRAYAVFGPKMLASRRRFADDALESRCITVRLHTTSREDVPLMLPDHFWQKALALRNRLVRFRLDNLATIEAPAVHVQRGCEPRVSQILGALQPFLGDDGLLADLRSEMQNSLADVRSDGVAADIAALLIQKRGTLSLKDIASNLRKRGQDVTEKRIGSVLRNDLGLGDYVRRTRNGAVVLPLPEELLEDLAVRYGFDASTDKPARGLWLLRRKEA